MDYNASKILKCEEGIAKSTNGTWSYCSYCNTNVNYRCSNSFAIFCDNTVQDPRVSVQKLGSSAGYISLKPGINYFHWCANRNINLRVASNTLEKAHFYLNDWIVLSPQPGVNWTPISFPLLKNYLEGKANSFFEADASPYNPTVRKLYRITQLILLSNNSAEPFPLETYSKLILFKNYLRGKPGTHYLPCFFKVSNKKRPSKESLGSYRALNVGRATVYELANLPYVHPYVYLPEFPGLNHESDTDPESEVDSGIETDY
jgi:hypothetical protein